MPSGITDFVGSEDLRVDPTPQGPQGRTKRPPPGGGEAPPPGKRQQEARPRQGGPGGQGPPGRTTPDRRRRLHTGNPPTGPERRAPGDPDPRRGGGDNKRENTPLSLATAISTHHNQHSQPTSRTPPSQNGFRKHAQSDWRRVSDCRRAHEARCNDEILSNQQVNLIGVKTKS